MPGFRKFDAAEIMCIKEHLKKHNIVVAPFHGLKKVTINKPCVDAASIEQRGCKEEEYEL